VSTIAGTAHKIRAVDSWGEIAMNRRSLAVRNDILRNLSLADFARLRPFLQSVVLNQHAVLEVSGKRIEYIYFIETGLVSLRTCDGRSALETALVGHRGIVGALIALDQEVSIHHSIVLIAGHAFRIRADDLRRLMSEQPLIREQLLQFVHVLMILGSLIALCGVRHQSEQRLASWLSAASEIIDSKILPITHDHLSSILGLPRAEVTRSLIRFQDKGLIQKTRGVIQVRERLLLMEKACDCYSVTSTRIMSKSLRIPEVHLPGRSTLPAGGDHLNHPIQFLTNARGGHNPE
jgi:CRP-like cAMP-binding protein